MNKLYKKRLHKLMKEVNKAGNAYTKAFIELDTFCDMAYGFTPADIEADEILDSVYCLRGMSDIDLMISPERFNFIMQDAAKENKS